MKIDRLIGILSILQQKEMVTAPDLARRFEVSRRTISRDDYLLGKEGVTKDLQRDWNWIRYKVGDKMFAAMCLDEEDRPYYITLKLRPEEGGFLREQYEDILPGYYMNKVHWNSIRPDGAVPDSLMKELLDQSYRLVLGSFSRKKQREILEAAKAKAGEISCCGISFPG